MLDLLPIEIIIQTFSHLDYRDLLTCSLVCRLFRATVQENASCQYTIHLAVSGMQDGPSSVVGHADRLTMLRNSQAAWHALEWTTLNVVPMSEGSLYELYGGVLVQSTQLRGCGLVFRRLPSHYRGIEEQVWSLDMDFILRDFTLDPAQDLLVLIAQPVVLVHDARIETLIHLRSLTTGKVHPLAIKSPVLVHDMDVHAAGLTFMLQVHGDRIAVHFMSHGVAPSELVVWNWKTGETVLNTYGGDLMAFSFLTGRFILVGGFRDAGMNLRQARLVVVDLDSGRGERTAFEQVEYQCAFLYPACFSWVHPLSFLIRSDPCSGWSPHGHVGVPFSIGPGPRLYVVTIWVLNGDGVLPIDLFVLSSTLLGYVGGERGRDVEWDEWGPRGTRMMAHAPHLHVWVCYVFGTRFSSIVGGRGERRLEVWDFNQLGIEREVEETSVMESGVFVDEVRTRLPYGVFRRNLTAPLDEYTEAMCSEDSVILVNSQGRRFCILSF